MLKSVKGVIAAPVLWAKNTTEWRRSIAPEARGLVHPVKIRHSRFFYRTFFGN